MAPWTSDYEPKRVVIYYHNTDWETEAAIKREQNRLWNLWIKFKSLSECLRLQRVPGTALCKLVNRDFKAPQNPKYTTGFL